MDCMKCAGTGIMHSLTTIGEPLGYTCPNCKGTGKASRLEEKMALGMQQKKARGIVRKKPFSPKAAK